MATRRRREIDTDRLLQDVLGIIRDDVRAIARLARSLKKASDGESTVGGESMEISLPEETALTLVRYAGVLGKMKQREEEDTLVRQKELRSMSTEDLRGLQEALKQ